MALLARNIYSNISVQSVQDCSLRSKTTRESKSKKTTRSRSGVLLVVLVVVVVAVTFL